MWSDISIDAGRYQVRLWKAGDGPALLFLHGFDGLPVGAPFLERLAQRHTVFAPELPGFGDSHGEEHFHGLLDAALLHHDFVEAAGGGPIDVIGHSLGGMFACELAAMWPMDVRRLVIVDAFGLWDDATPIPDFFSMSPRRLRNALWHDSESSASQQPIGVNGKTGIPATVTRSGNLATAGRFLWPIPDLGLNRRLHRIKAPTLAIWGASDGLVDPSYGDAFQAAIDDAQLIVIPDSGHYPMLEKPDEFSDAVEAFLNV